MADKLFQARVDERTAKRLQAYAEARSSEPKSKKKMSESDLVKYALDLVIKEADKQLAALQRKVRADAERTAQALAQGSTTVPRSTNALQLGPGVPAGTKTFQAKIDETKAARLQAFGRAYDASDSELIRRGFKLIIDETVRDKTHLLQQLHNDYMATRAALVGEDDNDPDTSPSPIGLLPESAPAEPNDHLVDAAAGRPNTPVVGDGPPH